MGFSVDKEKCVSCGVCWTTYPDIFEQDTDGKSKVKSNPAEPSKYSQSGEEIAGICGPGAIIYTEG